MDLRCAFALMAMADGTSLALIDTVCLLYAGTCDSWAIRVLLAAAARATACLSC